MPVQSDANVSNLQGGGRLFAYIHSGQPKGHVLQKCSFAGKWLNLLHRLSSHDLPCCRAFFVHADALCDQPCCAAGHEEGLLAARTGRHCSRKQAFSQMTPTALRGWRITPCWHHPRPRSGVARQAARTKRLLRHCSSRLRLQALSLCCSPLSRCQRRWSMWLLLPLAYSKQLQVMCHTLLSAAAVCSTPWPSHAACCIMREGWPVILSSTGPCHIPVSFSALALLTNYEHGSLHGTCQAESAREHA